MDTTVPVKQIASNVIKGVIASFFSIAACDAGFQGLPVLSRETHKKLHFIKHLKNTTLYSIEFLRTIIMLDPSK